MSKRDVKQVIVLRTDLKNTKGEKVRTGKLMAQVCHASMAVITKPVKDIENSSPFKTNDVFVSPFSIQGHPFSGTEKLVWENYSIKNRGEFLKWINEGFTKVVLKVSSEKELEEIYEKAIAAGLNATMIIDSGFTEFGGVPTKTCVGIGPNLDEEINKITGHLNLY